MTEQGHAAREAARAAAKKVLDGLDTAARLSRQPHLAEAFALDHWTDTLLAFAAARERPLRERVKELEATQATYHCGTLVLEHNVGSGHSAVEMPEPCPFERERDAALEVLGYKTDESRQVWLAAQERLRTELSELEHLRAAAAREGRAREEADKLQTTQSVCMCGDLVKDHTLYCGHSPVDMPEGPCPFELDHLHGWLEWRADWTGANGPIDHRTKEPWYVCALRGDKAPNGYPKVRARGAAPEGKEESGG